MRGNEILMRTETSGQWTHIVHGQRFCITLPAGIQERAQAQKCKGGGEFILFNKNITELNIFGIAKFQLFWRMIWDFSRESIFNILYQHLSYAHAHIGHAHFTLAENFAIATSESDFEMIATPQLVVKYPIKFDLDSTLQWFITLMQTKDESSGWQQAKRWWFTQIHPINNKFMQIAIRKERIRTLTENKTTLQLSLSFIDSDLLTRQNDKPCGQLLNEWLLHNCYSLER